MLLHPHPLYTTNPLCVCVCLCMRVRPNRINKLNTVLCMFLFDTYVCVCVTNVIEKQWINRATRRIRIEHRNTTTSTILPDGARNTHRAAAVRHQAKV